MVHQTGGVISPVPNGIDGETEAWEDKYWGAQSFREPWHLYQEQGAQSKLEKSSSEPAWRVCPSPSSLLFAYLFSPLVCSCDWFVCPFLHSGFSPLDSWRLSWASCGAQPRPLILKLVLYLSLLALFPTPGLLSRPVWAPPVLVWQGKNSPGSQSSWVLCSVHSVTLLLRINISCRLEMQVWILVLNVNYKVSLGTFQFWLFSPLLPSHSQGQLICWAQQAQHPGSVTLERDHQFFFFENQNMDFPSGPVVKTSSSNAGVVGSIPGWEAKIPYASGLKNWNSISTNSIKTLKMVHI